jgi:hypothetical protein
MAKIEEPPLLELKEAAAIGADQAPVTTKAGLLIQIFCET